MARNVVIATSRGRELKKHLPESVLVRYDGGASLEQLMEKAMTITTPTYHRNKRYHIYFVGGIPNITRLIKNRSENYRECVYDQDPSVTASKFLEKITEMQNVFLQRGALPIFATVPRVNLAKYNMYFILNGMTKQLKFSDQYATMQSKFDEALHTINNHIFETNQKVKVTTPLLHMTIRERRGSKKRYVAWKWELLYDGVHATEPLRKTWAGVLKEAMDENGKLEDAGEQDPPKRFSKFASERKGSE